MSEPAPASPSFSVFAHLNVEKTPLYRAILSFFVAERARFVIALRPSEIQAALSAAALPFDPLKSQIRNFRSAPSTPKPSPPLSSNCARGATSTIPPTTPTPPPSRSFINAAAFIN